MATSSSYSRPSFVRSVAPEITTHSPLTRSGAATPTLASSIEDLPGKTSNLSLTSRRDKYVVIGGGTGANSIIGAFERAKRVSFVLPISDDGGSSSEIQRVLGGGPSVGDIRSRLVRLIPTSAPGSPLDSIRRLLEYRLSETATSTEAKLEWHRIVEGKHSLWLGIPNDRKECIRSFLIHVNAAITKKASRGFNFQKASVGNLFLAGASLFLGSLSSAIFLFASITDIPHEKLRVIPVIATSSTATIAAQLEDGTIIAGQSEISHPSTTGMPHEALGAMTPFTRSATPFDNSSSTQEPLVPASPGFPGGSGAYMPRSVTPALHEARTLGDEEEEDEIDSDEPNQIHIMNKNPNVLFSKSTKEIPPLNSEIKRIFYLNAYGNEIFPRANPQFIDSLMGSTCLVYSCGSLYTSIIPCLALRGVGTAIATAPALRYRILLLNSHHDRETPNSYTALDFVEAIRSTCSEAFDLTTIDQGRDMGFGGTERGTGTRRLDAREVVSHVVYLQDGQIPVDVDMLETMGIHCVAVNSQSGMFDEYCVAQALSEVYRS
ncbi:hypothetical protein OIO90_002152 [Microbotryomycetes sp. JL221]|nr:hypothetical protein OIO90_002152 [Microbotryomycetes sp. JL221]